MLVLFAVLSVMLVFDPRLWPTDPIADLSAPWIMPQHGTMLDSTNLLPNQSNSAQLCYESDAHVKQYRLLSERHGVVNVFANNVVQPHPRTHRPRANRPLGGSLRNFALGRALELTRPRSQC